MLRKFVSQTTTAVTATVAVCLLSTSAAWAEASLAEMGKRHFIRCSACHSVTADGPSHLEGPHLEGIVGRLAGSVEGYNYTQPELISQSFHWDEATLDQWLTKPHDLIPDMCLPFFGLPREEHRKALIEFFKHPNQ